MLLNPPTYFAIAADLEPPPRDSRNPCEWVRNADNTIWLRKTLPSTRLLGEALAIAIADFFDVQLADGAVDIPSGTWFSRRLDLLSWDAAHGPGVDKLQLARLILFDLALGIPDRHPGNLLLSPFCGRYWPIGIDHELAVAAYQGPLAVPIRHPLPGAPLSDPELRESLHVSASNLATPPGPDITSLGETFSDEDIAGVQRAVRARCRALPRLLETWIHHQESLA